MRALARRLCDEVGGHYSHVSAGASVMMMGALLKKAFADKEVRAHGLMEWVYAVIIHAELGDLFEMEGGRFKAGNRTEMH